MCSFEQGVFADVEPKVRKYWYLGFLKDKFVYFKNSFKERKPIQNSKLEYVAPCSGCSQCYVPPKVKNKLNENRWWSAFLPRNPHPQISDSTPNYSSIINEDCGKHLELKPSYSNITACTAAVNETRMNIGGSLCIKVYPISLSTKQFISYGLRYHRSKLSDDSISTVVKARELIIESAEEADSDDVVNVEKGSEHTEEFYYIDNEKYKRASCSISLLPKQVTLYG
ncbi:acylglycerol kinase, mitochondrial-like [Stegodyphus dumicola]|uniref:acylglycerol kinase, mitochondrial-like n=1 Tax=Stegodyphus dumicola TaxID=202533 RepID=UPI0015B1E4EC|nr:acylglycerol kinase, mitochondrial-like [Stegodyphus dumicola]